MKPWYSSTLGRVILVLFIFAAVALSRLAHADVVEFSEDELSRESVLPIFDEPEAVKKRVVPTDSRIEIEAYGTTILNDPFLNVYGVGGDLEYHLSETNAVGVNVAGMFGSNSSYVAQINSQIAGASQYIGFNNNPNPVYLALAEYEFTPFYGKISITKQGVLNLNISGTIRAGMIGFNNESSPAVGLGLNERFFFTRNFGLKLDLQGLVYQKTDVIPVNPGKATQFNILLSLGALWFFPQL